MKYSKNCFEQGQCDQIWYILSPDPELAQSCNIPTCEQNGRYIKSDKIIGLINSGF